jgi:pseudaminic acid synthase
MIISTGIATIEEIQDAVDICRKEGNNDIVLLKCTSAYPAALEDANLLTIQNLADTFGVISGFSDHTLGTTAPIVATTLGAKVIEKHFILDKAIGGADADFSLDKQEFAEMVRAVRDTEKLLGKVDYAMTEKKKKSRQFSRSLYVAKDIKKGEKFTEDNVRSVRPGYGMHPKHLNTILGKLATKDLKSGDALTFSVVK